MQSLSLAPRCLRPCTTTTVTASRRMATKDAQTRTFAMSSYRRPYFTRTPTPLSLRVSRAEFLRQEKPVHLLVLGPQMPPKDEAVVEGLASISNVKGRGDFPNDLTHLTDADWEEIEVLLLTTMSGNGLQGAVERAKNLKWVHTFTAGVNQLAIPPIVNSEICVTNAKGVYSHSLAEYALFACNYFAKDLPRLLKAKSERKWDVFPVEELRGRTMGIIGLGDIGFSTARIAKAFQMKIIGVRRNLSMTDSEKQIVDAVYGPEELVRVMGMCDYVVAALPMTEKTVNMIDAAAIDAMQPHAVFINIGRGKSVVEPALIQALREKRIKGAALDVFYDEPLTPESPMYDLENLLISSHTADFTDHSVSDSLLLFKEILEEYIQGKELRNVVDVSRGY